MAAVPAPDCAQNLLYGACSPVTGERKPLSDIVELLGIVSLSDRRPATLSGGESSGSRSAARC